MRWPPPPDWPMAAHSRRVLCRPHRWHVQEAGTGETLLLIHGAGGATQSWRALFPLLAQGHHVIAVDLPGQGFSQSGAQTRLGLGSMAADLAALCADQGWQPSRIIGHSAGVPIALALVGEGLRPPRGITGINAALSQFKGVAGVMFPMMAKALAMTPLTAQVFSATATPASVRRLIAGTGSTLDDAGLNLYLRLARDRAHVDATLSMMAQWDLAPLLARLPAIDLPVHLITGSADRAVPPQTSRDAAARLPAARVTDLPGLGHLAHEEDAAAIAALLT